jgi:hypothetical protein
MRSALGAKRFAAEPGNLSEVEDAAFDAMVGL